MIKASRANELHTWKLTQGNGKMLRYIEELIRNKNFQKDIRRLRRLNRKSEVSRPKGLYSTWTSEQKKKSDDFSNECSGIIEGYELLRKRCKKLLRSRGFAQEEKIAYNYGLDLELQMFALGLMDNTNLYPELALSGDPVDMCCLVDACEEQLRPFNKGDEIIYLNAKRHLRLAAFPIAICINQRASKRDVLDYIEKRWDWVEGMRSSYKEKTLKLRKRKHSQEIIDYLWENRMFPAKKIKESLNKEFPNNGLVYYEISKIIHLEVERRHKDI